MKNCSRSIGVLIFLVLIAVVLPAVAAEKKRSRWNPFGGITESIDEARAEIQSLNREISDTKREVSNTTGEIKAEVSNTTGEIKAEVSNTTGEIKAEVSNTTGEIRAEISDTTGEIQETNETIAETLQMAEMIKAMTQQSSSAGTTTLTCEGRSCEGQAQSARVRAETNVFPVAAKSADASIRKISDEEAAKTIAAMDPERRAAFDSLPPEMREQVLEILARETPTKGQ